MEPPNLIDDARESAADERDGAASRREAVADERDGTAHRRDVLADERDGAAARRDLLADERDEAVGPGRAPVGHSAVEQRRETAVENRSAATSARDDAERMRDSADGARLSAATERAAAASKRSMVAAEEFAEFGNLLEASTEYAMVAVDAGGRILLWNEGARRIYGYERPEIVGEPHALLHTAEDVSAGLPRKMAVQVLRDGVWAGIVEHRRKDGTRFTARAVKTRRRDSMNHVNGFLLISSDVTDEVRLIKELEATRRFSETLVESAPDAMVIVEEDGSIVLVNAAAESLFGYTRTELIGSSLDVLVPDRYRAAHAGNRQAFFSEPKARAMGAGLALTGRRKDGIEVPVEISLSPFISDERALITASIRDVSDRIRNERELRETNVALEGASRAKDRFLANMSHELRTPLNAILGFTGTILMELPGPLNEEQTKQLRTVQSSGKHLLSLINDLLDLSRIESGKLELKFEPIVGSELLEEIATGLRPLADAKGIKLRVLAEPAVIVDADRRALRQILINLANNAIKFTDEGSVVLALSRGTDEHSAAIRFSVIDTGSGIAPSDQAKLFEAFEQVTGSRGRPYEGTGLGLYICRMLAGVLGATLSFESVLGSGSNFTLELGE